ncbi:UNC-like C-terminal-domain-containing protein [Pisolithus croceorrhizus]|nr:UNC-like C-terminal-domain-containing protein [Pisolithus croceorrhizus]
MLSLSLLPWTLLVLAFVATLAVSQVTVSTNDPFRAIVVKHRALHPEPPLCCLKPLPSADPPEGPEDILLSFEEWKSKQLHAHSRTVSQQASPPTTTEASERTISDPRHHRDTDATPSPVDVHATVSEPSFPQDSLPAHFRVPITDRFNYANMDCSARVHMAHRSAKSASSILSEKKDKYMLSPCTTKKGEAQFVVVELCDDIRIDTVQLANFEFFSGVFKDFTVRVAKTYTATDDGWTFAGTYRGKNIRGVQSFHPPTSLRDFYRYIRIDFHSYYGQEYYCPISLLRVYGLTHLEQWKWVMWEEESRARLEEQRLLIPEGIPVSSGSMYPPSTGINTPTDILESGSVNASAVINGGNSSSYRGSNAIGLTDSSSTVQAPLGGSSPTSSATPPAARGSPESIPFHTVEYSQVTSHVMSSSLAEVISSIASIMSHETPFTTSHSQPTGEHPSTHVLESQSSRTLSTHASVTSAAFNSRSYTSVHSPAPGGESIFGTIMNKLTALEVNHTLYARYVEEQIAGVREVLRKLGEEVGRLESIEQMQSQMYLRTVQEWERQRLRLELEHSELLSRVNHLTDEVVLEKRLGIAQLCLLLAVLVFMGFTRGTPYVEQSQAGFNRSTRQWGMRTLSLGSNKELGGWNPLRLRSPSPAVQRNSAGKTPEARVAFPSSISRRQSSFISLNPRHVQGESVSSSTSSLHNHLHGHHSTRTPTRHKEVAAVDPRSIPRALPIAKSNSSTASPHATPRSTKRLARTAHLHEVKLFRHRRGSGTGMARRLERRNNEGIGHDDDVFRAGPPRSSPPDTPHKKHRKPLSPLFSTARSEDDKEADGWIDTDMDGSEPPTDTAAYDST